jgi:hypothetical protein
MPTTQTTEKAEAHTAEDVPKQSRSPRIGKYGKAVVVKSVDFTWKKFAVIRPFAGTHWYESEAEANRVCERYNAAEIPKAEKGAQ